MLGAVRRRLSSLPAHMPLTLPALSPTMVEGRVARWTKGVGDGIKAGDTVAEIETDKATVDFQVVEDGFLAKIFVDGSSGKMVKVGEIIGVMVEEKKDVPAFASAKAEDIIGGKPTSQAQTSAPAPSQQPQPAQADIKRAVDAGIPPKAASPVVQSASSAARVFASPLARKTAADSGVSVQDLAGRGTGPNGRIVKVDVLDFLSAPRPVKAQQPSAAPAPAPAPSSSSSKQQQQPAGAYTDSPVDQETIQLALQSIQSKREVPHYYLNMEIEINELLKLRDTLNASLAPSTPEKGEDSKKISVNDFLVRASAVALQRVPAANSSWMGTFIRQYHNCHINISVAKSSSPGGPAKTSSILIKNVESKGLASISEESKKLFASASPEGVPGELGTFTITNLGAYGVKQYAPIIRQPQAVSLGVGAIRQIIVPAKNKEGKDDMKVVSLLPVTLSCDHRVVDGAVSAQWMQHFRSLLTNPLTLLL